MKKLLVGSLLLSAVFNTVFAADNTSQQIQLLNSQIQAQLQKMQTDQQTQIQTLNTQIQTQIKQIQTDLQAQISKVNSQTQDQIKQLQATLEQQIKQVQQQAVPAAKPKCREGLKCNHPNVLCISGWC